MAETIIKLLPYLIPVLIVVFLGGVVCGIKLGTWARRNRRVGINNVRKMESE
jgi:hypothetical protein